MAAGLVAGVGVLGAGAILRTDERIRGDKDEQRMSGVAETEHRRKEAPDIAQADPCDQPPFNGTYASGDPLGNVRTGRPAWRPSGKRSALPDVCG